MSRIPEDVLDAIRQSIDLVDLVGRYVPMRRSGRSWSACCPFHQEKTPSFHVWPETGTWKCFGCGKAGNAFSFLMEKEGLGFREAAVQLAREAGITLPDEDPGARELASRLDVLREVCEWACRFFEKGLRGAAGRRAVDYLKRRGITGESAAAFRLGYAPQGWESLLQEGTGAGHSEDLLVEAGLLVRRDPTGGRSGTYDRFRDRLVFPIADDRGRVIAFGARTLSDEEPKYLNSPETPLFTKGRHLYALHLAKSEMLRTGDGAVMEGYTDVIMAHQAGFRVAVAGLGTALTPEQARRVSRYVKRLWLLYDGDAAGLRAAERAIPSFLPEDIETRVAVLPPGSDPADLLLSGGVDALRVHLDGAREAFEHLLATWSSGAEGVAGWSGVVNQLLEAVARVGDGTRRQLYVKRVADAVSALGTMSGIDEEELHRRVARLAARPKGRGAAAREAAPDPDDPGPQPEEEPLRPVPEVERKLLEALLGDPALVEVALDLPPEALRDPRARKLFAALREAGRAGQEPGSLARQVVGGLADPTVARLAADIMSGLELFTAPAELARQARDCVTLLGEQRERIALQQRLEAAAAGHRVDEQDQALRDLVELHRRRAQRGRGAP